MDSATFVKVRRVAAKCLQTPESAITAETPLPDDPEDDPVFEELMSGLEGLFGPEAVGAASERISAHAAELTFGIVADTIDLVRGEAAEVS